MVCSRGSWPDGGNSPFRGEKGTTFEGGFRVPLVVRWPGTIKPDTTNPNRATITLTYLAPLSATAYDGKMPIKLMVKEKDGSITDSDTIYVDVYVYGSSNG